MMQYNEAELSSPIKEAHLPFKSNYSNQLFPVPLISPRVLEPPSPQSHVYRSLFTKYKYPYLKYIKRKSRRIQNKYNYINHIISFTNACIMACNLLYSNINNCSNISDYHSESFNDSSDYSHNNPIIHNDMINMIQFWSASKQLPLLVGNYFMPTVAQSRIQQCLLEQCRQFIRYTKRKGVICRSFENKTCGDPSKYYSPKAYGLNHSITLYSYIKWMSSIQPMPSSFCISDSYSLHTHNNSNTFSTFDCSTDPVGQPQAEIFRIPESFANYLGTSTEITAIPIVADRVALPDIVSRVSILSLLPDYIKNIYNNPIQLLAGTTQPNNIYKRKQARFFGDHKEYIALIKRMFAIHMISFTSKPLAVNGLFGVPKDGTDIRLIIDAKPANKCFIEPPYVQLPNPSCLSRLYCDAKSSLFVAKADLSNFYHQLLIPEWLQPYLSLPSLSISELLQQGITLPHNLQSLPGSTAVYPMCLTLPMGWSHSVFIAQSIHEYILYYTSSFSPTDNILFTTTPNIDRGLHGLYIDDLFILAPSKQEAECLLDKAKASYINSNLLIKAKKVVEPTNDNTEILGHLLNCSNKQLLPTPEKIEYLIQQTFYVITTKHSITGNDLAQLIGKWTWCLLIKRPTLSVLRYSYRYVNAAGSKSWQLWTSVKQELMMLLLIMPLLQYKLSNCWCPTMFATDASNLAAGVVTTNLTSELFKAIWPLSASKHTLYYNVVYFNSPQVDPSCIVQPKSEMLHDAELHSTSVLSQPGMHLLSNFNSSEEEHNINKCIHQGIQSNVLALSKLLSTNKLQWTTIISYPWKFKSSHINSLELQAIILAIRRSLSSPTSIGKRMILLTDSAVVAYSIIKGRSSSSHLIPGLRKLAALCLSGDIALQIGWIPTHLNPADGPSRLRST